MAYARFTPGSDVYIFADIYGGITCCGCFLGPNSFNCETVDEMLSHLEKHKAAGHEVPERAIECLIEDREWIEGDRYEAG